MIENIRVLDKFSPKGISMKRPGIFSLITMSLFVFLFGTSVLFAQLPQNKAATYVIQPPSAWNQEPREFSIDYKSLKGNQSEVTAAVYKEFRRSDQKLNEIYRKIFVKYKSNPLFLKKLTLAERAWISYRDAHLESLYPESDRQYQYNGLYSIAYFLEKAHLTWERAKQLNEWLKNNGAWVNGVENRVRKN